MKEKGSMPCYIKLQRMIMRGICIEIFAQKNEQNDNMISCTASL